MSDAPPPHAAIIINIITAVTTGVYPAERDMILAIVISAMFRSAVFRSAMFRSPWPNATDRQH
jgi:hypothetical protein